MRLFPAMAATILTFALVACAESGETYQVGVDEAWSKVAGVGYSASNFGLPAGLRSADVEASFEPSPGDRTGYWKFTRKGKELGRLNIAVEGDQTSSKVRYSYVAGDLSANDKPIDQTIRQISQPLFVEAVDATIENRAPEQSMKKVADAESAKQLANRLVEETYSAIGKATKESDKFWEQRDAEMAADNVDAAFHSERARVAKPTTDLSDY